MNNNKFRFGLVAVFSLFCSIASSRSQVPPQPNVIYLHAGEIDTSAPQTQARAKALAATTGKQLRLIQFDGPIQPAWVMDLEKSGLQIIDYIPENTYLVYGDAPAVQSMQAKVAPKSHVRWEGEYRGIDKIHPSARPEAAGKNALRALDPDLYAIQLVLDPAANKETLARIEAAALEPIRRQQAVGHYYNVVVRLPADSISGLAEQPDVISIWPYITPQKRDERQGMIVAGQLSGNNPTGPGYLQWLAGKGFTQEQFDASGLVVDVTDSGVDNGLTNDVRHFALFRQGTTNGVARLRYSRLEGTANTGSSIKGLDGHGNINAHIIGGYVGLTNSPHTDSAGYRYGLGIAPFVRVGSSVIFDPNTFTSPNYNNLASRAYRDGARISGNSWGADTAGGYDTDAQNYDFLVRDAQPGAAAVPAAGNQELCFVFAAGNAGSGAGTVGSPGTAKNVITVGAAENVHPFGGADGCDTPDSEANSANDIATFSSRGPCDDQRKKPDIMAPGTHVTGGVAQNVRSMSGTGTALTGYTGEGVCGGVNSIYFPSAGQQFYTASSGTSHSTPAVAGGAALVYQWFLNSGRSAPSPAMIKSFLMNSARYMSGTGANDALYSNNQGMGMMNLETSFDGTPRLMRDQLSEDIFTASGQARTWTGSVAASGKPLRITLAWTDAPGSTTGNAYKNNLDLTVTVNGQLYRGNVFSGANSTAGGTADVRNNVESVFLPAGISGAVTITVTGTNINSDGVPNSGTVIDQDFALVAYNFTEVQAPAIAGAGSSLVAEEADSANNAIDPAEVVTVAFSLRNVGNLPTANLTATLLATNGVTPLATGPVNYGALAAGGTSVTRNFDFVADGDCGSVVTAVLALQDGTNNLGTVPFDFALGTFSSLTATNTNASAITIRDNNSATPYPSAINVSGRVGKVAKVTVSIPAFSHTYPGDVDMVLVSPDGKKVALMGGVGAGTDAVNVALTFDDAASGPIGASVVAGTYQPSGSVSTMPAGAPAGPYASALSEFNGISPNGTWSLYVADSGASDTGTMAQGWRIAITTSQATCLGVNQPPSVSLDSPANGSAVLAGQPVNLSATVTDLAADGSPGVVSKVEFFEGSNLLATLNSSPYTATWTPPAAGSYTLTARATDSDGAVTDSSPVTIGVLSGNGSPTISGFSPPGGAPTSAVVITGTNFAGVTAVLFNGLAAASFTVDSTSQITAIVPAAATTGPVSVVNSFGTATSAENFTILQSSVLISQIYGGGGNTGAAYRNDYVELYNRGSSAQSLSGWTIQYTSATGTSWQTAALSGSIAPGKYFLVQLGGGSSGATLPTPDATGTIGMSATVGKVALRSSATAFTGGSPVGQAGLEDFVGYGTTASAFEGAGAAPAPSATTAILRAGGGATDTQNNNSDFSVAAPNPRNSGSGTTVAPVITSPSTANGTVGQSFTYQITASNSPTSFNATGLPLNLSVNTNTGLISGVPAAVGTNSVTVFAGNSAGTGSNNLSITILPAGGGGTEIFREDFASITGGNNTNSSGSSTAWSGNTNFPTVAAAYQAGGAVRLGTGSAIGSITSRPLDLSVNGGNFTVSYKVKGWTAVEGNIKVTVGSVSQTNTYTAVMAGGFETKTLNFTGGTTNSTVKIETTAKRAFIDDVVVTSAATASPVIEANGALSPLGAVYGSASTTPASFNVSGNNLTAGILITPPAGFEVSQTSSDSGYAATQTVGSAGAVAPTTVYVRLAAGTASGTYSGNVVCSSAGANSVAVAVPPSSVQQAPLSITADDIVKPYGQELTLGAGQTGFSSIGLVGAETIGSVTLSADGGTAADAAPGDYTLTPSAATGGSFAPGNYSISYKSGKLTVAPAPTPTFEEWSAQKGLAGPDALPSADPDKDDLVNLLEYYMGLEPLDADQNAVSVDWNPGNPSSISMSYRRAKGTIGISGGVRWTSLLDSGNWSTNGVTESAIDMTNYFDVTATVTNAPSDTRKFLRLELQSQ